MTTTMIRNEDNRAQATTILTPTAGRDCGDGESVRERELRWRTWRSECRRVWWQPQVLQDAVNDGAVGYQGDQAAA